MYKSLRNYECTKQERMQANESKECEASCLSRNYEQGPSSCTKAAITLAGLNKPFQQENQLNACLFLFKKLIRARMCRSFFRNIMHRMYCVNFSRLVGGISGQSGQGGAIDVIINGNGCTSLWNGGLWGICRIKF